MEALMTFATTYGGPIAVMAAAILIVAWAAWNVGRWAARRERGETLLDQHMRDCGEASREVRASLSKLHQRIDGLAKQVAKIEGKLEERE